MQLCPLCHKPHDDPPTAGRARVCEGCCLPGGPSQARSKPNKKRRSKQTPVPLEAPPSPT